MLTFFYDSMNPPSAASSSIHLFSLSYLILSGLMLPYLILSYLILSLDTVQAHYLHLTGSTVDSNLKSLSLKESTIQDPSY